ncbi:hypothetical protein EUA04_08410 [Mycolicibacterium obuense]|uniref:Novel STAND NTPase 3 domain-containing protein n=1 Tax=Mycolicibacterium obuense TaxID=1807 RepID=A0A4R5X9L1_9MYCO|nr:hypothetical protein [Mycolicibacterium obuense]TDL09960.1 hypothetical protein EUA04_08410 [Mycolicibacterium obuense]
MSGPDYELHKLGWRAFQDLCGVVLQEVLGQAFAVFADTNDAGQDGAFHGFWTTPDSAPDAELEDFVSATTPVVVQCKFSAEPSGTLAPSDLENELTKLADLHARGLCDAYMVLTNLRVTGRTQAWLGEEVLKRGLKVAAILPGSWICTQIEKNWNLRRYVPRVYGLGDLASILDERRIRQARALLTSLSRELETFVPTSAYRSASDSITEHGFVLLLGEPASGKSTIAAMLCMTALDRWQCDVMRVDGPAELLSHWNADDPQQMFWVDDAFGSIRHEPHLTDAWVRRMTEVMAAVSHGARVLMTSRDYIYREAQPRMKEYAFPRLSEQQVVIDVTELSSSEKQQMLYNHLKAGDQPAKVLNGWRPHLQAVAAADRFQPEVARRLSLQQFVPARGLHGRADLVAFFEHPNEFLVDVLDGLEPAQRAALAAIYLSGGELLAPFAPDTRLSAAVEALGATVAETTRAASAIEGTFLSQLVRADGNTVWRFHHPTIREGFAASVARDISTLEIYLQGMTPDELVAELDCGGPNQSGTFVRVPPAMYGLIASRVPVPGPREWSSSPGAWFLRTRCSNEFLRLWAEAHRDALPGMANFGMMVEAMWEPGVLCRLNDAGALPEAVRLKAVKRIVEYSIDDLDPAWADTQLDGLFEVQERADLLRQVEEDVLPNLEERIDNHVSCFGSDTTKDELYETPRDYLRAIRRVFGDRTDILERCDEVDEYIIEQAASDEDEPESQAETSGLAAPAPPASAEILNPRDPFEDVAAGH